MTLTPAIREALMQSPEVFAALKTLSGSRARSHLINSMPQEGCVDCEPIFAAYDAIGTTLLSVVAAEEGRKYEALVKLVKEWQGARRQVMAPTAMPWGNQRHRESEDFDAACRALAQWEAK